MKTRSSRQQRHGFGITARSCRPCDRYVTGKIGWPGTVLPADHAWLLKVLEVERMKQKRP